MSSAVYLFMNSAHSLTFPSLRYVTAHSPTLPSLYLRHSTFSNPSVASPMSQFILQPFFRFSYVSSPSLMSPGEPPIINALFKWSHCMIFLRGPAQPYLVNVKVVLKYCTCVKNYKGQTNENRTPSTKHIPRKSWQHCCYVLILPSVGKETCIEKTHRSTQFFLYFFGAEPSVKGVHPALEMEAIE